MSIFTAIGLASLVTALAAVPVFAADTEQSRSESQHTQMAKATLSEAIATAENQVGGTAVSARLEHEGGKAVYEVRVLKDSKLSSVHVSADDGKVLSTREIMAHHKPKMHHQEPEHQSNEKS